MGKTNEVMAFVAGGLMFIAAIAAFGGHFAQAGAFAAGAVMTGVIMYIAEKAR